MDEALVYGHPLVRAALFGFQDVDDRYEIGTEAHRFYSAVHRLQLARPTTILRLLKLIVFPELLGHSVNLRSQKVLALLRDIERYME